MKSNSQLKRLFAASRLLNKEQAHAFPTNFWQIAISIGLVSILLSGDLSSAQNENDLSVEVEVLTSDPMQVYLNDEEAVMHRSGKFGFAQANVGAVNKLRLVHETSRVLMYKVDGAGFKVVKPKNGINTVEFDITQINGDDEVIKITTQSDLTVFEGQTDFSFRDLAEKKTFEVPLKGELFDSLDLACRTLTLHSTPSGESYRSGFRRWWRHELVLEASLCEKESSNRQQLLRPACCNRWSCSSAADLCQVDLIVPISVGAIRLSLSFPEMRTSVRYKDRDNIRLIPNVRGKLKIAIE